MTEERGAFVKVKCSECGNEQIVFEKPASQVECVVCDTTLARSTGGKARFQAKVVSSVT